MSWLRVEDPKTGWMRKLSVDLFLISIDSNPLPALGQFFKWGWGVGVEEDLKDPRRYGSKLTIWKVQGRYDTVKRTMALNSDILG